MTVDSSYRSYDEERREHENAEERVCQGFQRIPEIWGCMSHVFLSETKVSQHIELCQ